MYHLKENIVYNQIGKEIVIKNPGSENTIFLNQTASSIFRAVVEKKDVKREIELKYELSEEDYEKKRPEIDEVLNKLIRLGVIYES